MNGNNLYVARQLFSWMKLKRARIESDGNFVSGDLMARPGIAIVQYWARHRSHRIRLQTPSLRQELPRGDGILIKHQAPIGIQSGHRMLQRISRIGRSRRQHNFPPSINVWRSCRCRVDDPIIESTETIMVTLLRCATRQDRYSHFVHPSSSAKSVEIARL